MLQFEIDVAAAIPAEASNDPDVLFDLGIVCSSGRTGVVDLVSAHKWFNLAALKGRSDAVSMRREIAAMMSDAEIALAQREARAWVTTH
ncbi:hypothetical protein JQ557_34680 [Bradyrhizobium sp. U87765 SZCCT0131]|uniref:hypothetical protein n=1 Tax=unclassified Bradyrhizobium TaxID=2631580 RepID=UPI001BA7DC44|nr:MULTISPECIES: hypothetical protein [unclassified Bradyrhizobium]MBR1223188.1 hypothetical protein [Bradyrhizobium sp. U87765 SZCCT0131]MBR1265809.1 hypothetical protein [Bradyrhizobium sp. U87765 SZCCT0134]MBR1309398.1 hypothetical protein [Bradyrhizobium sp. U87765 SZCCT0110]MBR1324076.1 hypothetical protein [Bradyrhizobium sp. U87765 SZCCT0109]MBR1348233.1 hypothetical protein [Bradyrhizobium sp. U87765 SZCCT0048]